MAFRTRGRTTKYATNASANMIKPIQEFNVTTIASCATPKIHTKLSPANACPHCGERPPEGTRGQSDGQNRGTDRQYALRQSQGVLFGKDQPINESEVCQHQKNEP